jgi:hypothetical protein
MTAGVVRLAAAGDGARTAGAKPARLSHRARKQTTRATMDSPGDQRKKSSSEM